MSTQNPTGGAAAGLSPAILPPNIFDPRLNGADWYTYLVDAGNSPAPIGGGANLAAGGSSNPTLQIDAGTDFYLIALSYQAQVNAAGGLTESSNPVPLVTMQLTDSGSTRSLFSSAAPLAAVAGDGKRPARLIRPRLFRALSQLSFAFTSLEPATVYAHLYVVLWGYRKFAGS
jgi:hypothetical protein